MNFIKFSAIAAVIAVMALTTSCSNDVSVLENEATLKNEGLAAARGIIPGQAPANGNWVVSGIKVFFDGYYETYSSLPSQFQFNNSGTVNSKYAVGGRSFNGSYYVLGDTKSTGKRGILKLDGSLGGDQFLPSVPNSGDLKGQDFEVNFTLFDASTGYYTDVQKSPGKIYVFNPSTMVKSGTIDIYGQVASRVSGFSSANYKHIGGKLLIRRGNYLYADVTFGKDLNRLKQVVQADNNIRVAVYDLRRKRVVKVLVGANAQNIGLFNDHPLVNIDPVTKDIYFATVGDMVLSKQPKNTSQIFKIDGANKLSSVVGYQDVAKDKKTGKPLAGEFNRLYVYNGVIYTTIGKKTARYMGNATTNSHYYYDGKGNNYRDNIWEWSTIKNRTVTKITNVKPDNFYAYQQPVLINGEIYFIVNNKKSIIYNAYGYPEYNARVFKVTAGSTTNTATLVTKAKGGNAGWGLLSPNKISSINKL